MGNDCIEEPTPVKKPSILQRLDSTIREKLAHIILSWKPGGLLLSLVGAGLLLGVADIFVRLLMYKIRLGTISEVTGRFITSPGAAGLAALAAAIIGAVMISKQLKLARATAHESEWWSKFEWVTERALPSDKEHVRIPDHVSLNFLNQLQGTAQSAIQQEACGGFVDHLGALVQVEPEQPVHGLAKNGGVPDPGVADPGVPDPAVADPAVADPDLADPDLAGLDAVDVVVSKPFNIHVSENDRNTRAWANYVENTRHTPARSTEAEMISEINERKNYEHQTFLALSKIDGVTDVKVEGSGEAYRTAHLDYRGSEVSILLRYIVPSRPYLNVGRVSADGKKFAPFDRRLNLSLTKLNPDAKRVIIISNHRSKAEIRPVLGRKVEFVEWRPGDMLDPLKLALDNLSS